MCTYRHPFTARSQGGLILKILNDNPEPINDCYSKELKNLLNLIFDKNYEKPPSYLEILRMHYVIEKAKNLGIFDDIKNSFPDIKNISISNRNNIKSSNKINMVHIKPVIMANNKKIIIITIILKKGQHLVI